MATEAQDRLFLNWLASPTLPVGGFSYSEGLEAAVHHGQVRTEEQASQWLMEQLQLGQGRSDLPVVAQAIAAWRARDWNRVAALNTWVLTTRESGEFRLQSVQTGRSLVEWLRQLPAPWTPNAEDLQWVKALPPTWPVAFALAAAQTQAPVRDGVMACALGWAENLSQAAIKAVPLGQTGGQRILARLLQAIPDVADQALALADGERQAFSPMLAILSARHEAQYSRLFRS
jgi:urease accessory protein